MKIFNETDLLNWGFRAKIIEEIEGSENIQRKEEQRRKWEIYKDRVKHYVISELRKELDANTVEEMKSRASSINLYKKIVNKKARVYQTSPARTLNDEHSEDDAEVFGTLQDLLNINTKLKKSNRFLEAFLNVAIHVRPFQKFDEFTESGANKWEYEVKIIPPHQYDVIEDSQNPEIPRVFILSDFSPEIIQTDLNPSNHHGSPKATSFRSGDSKDQKIADSEADRDEPHKEYIWWATDFHFTTNHKAEIVHEKSPDDLINPIGTIPFVHIARDRDGFFWSVGGEDLVDGTVLINVLITDQHFIQKVQGMGLFYFFGKGVPETFKIGPNRALTLNQEPDDPTPQIGFASSNPPLGDHMRATEQYAAMLLTTNDLGTNAVASKLDGSNPTSGIKDLIQHSEPLNAIEDDQEIYRDVEPAMFDIISKWHNYYFDKGLLVDKLAQLGELPKFNFSLRFPKPEQFTTEEQRRNNQKLRKDLGIADRVAILMEDEPDLTEEQAEERILKMEERKLRINRTKIMGIENGAESDEEAGPKAEEGSEE